MEFAKCALYVLRVPRYEAPLNSLNYQLHQIFHIRTSSYMRRPLWNPNSKYNRNTRTYKTPAS